MTGEQIIDREEVYENNIVLKDSTAKMENEKTNMVAVDAQEEEVKEEVKEKRGLTWFQQMLMYFGIGAVLGFILYVLKRLKII